MARRGQNVDGHQYIPGVLAAGGFGFGGRRSGGDTKGVVTILAEDASVALAHLCEAWCEHPTNGYGRRHRHEWEDHGDLVDPSTGASRWY